MSIDSNFYKTRYTGRSVAFEHSLACAMQSLTKMRNIYTSRSDLLLSTDRETQIYVVDCILFASKCSPGLIWSQRERCLHDV